MKKGQVEMTAYDIELGEERLRKILLHMKQARELGRRVLAVAPLNIDNIIKSILRARFGCTFRLEIYAEDYKVWIIEWE